MMKITKSMLFRTTLCMVCALILTGCIARSTGPTEVGVRTVKFSLTGKTGVQDEVYPPGSTYFFLPFVNDWHTFETQLHNLEMTAAEMKGDRPGRDDLLFKTIDGNDISLDVIITWKIDPDQAPRILREVASNDEDLKENVVRTVARSKPRDIFGELMAEEFYLAEKRTGKQNEALEALNEILNPYGVIVQKVGLRNYRFNPAYEAAIEDRKVADQRTEKLKSQTDAAVQEYLRKVEEARGQIAQVKAKADGEFRRASIEADAYFEQQGQVAQAIEAEGKAEATAIYRLNQALSGAGGEAMVKLAIADALKGKKIFLLPMGQGGLDVRSTDVNALLDLYGLQALTAPKEEREAAPAP